MSSGAMVVTSCPSSPGSWLVNVPSGARASRVSMKCAHGREANSASMAFVSTGRSCSMGSLRVIGMPIQYTVRPGCSTMSSTSPMRRWYSVAHAGVPSWSTLPSSRVMPCVSLPPKPRTTTSGSCCAMSAVSLAGQSKKSVRTSPVEPFQSSMTSTGSSAGSSCSRAGAIHPTSESPATRTRRGSASVGMRTAIVVVAFAGAACSSFAGSSPPSLPPPPPIAHASTSTVTRHSAPNVASRPQFGVMGDGRWGAAMAEGPSLLDQLGPCTSRRAPACSAAPSRGVGVRPWGRRGRRR